MDTKGMPGGAQKAGVTTSPVAVDLTPLAKQLVEIWSDDQDLIFCLSDGSSTALVYTGDLAASDTALKASRIAKGYPKRLLVSPRFVWLVVATVTGTALVHVKSVSDELGGV